MRSVTLALTLAIAALVALTGTAFAQGSPVPGPTGGNMTNSGSVRSDAERRTPSRDAPARTGTIAPAAPGGAGTGAATDMPASGPRSGGAATGTGR